MNFLDLCQRLVQETGIADEGPATVTGQTGDMGRIVNWINDAWLKIQSIRADWNWAWSTGTSTLTAATNTVTLPATVETIKRVSIGQGFLQALDYNDFADNYRVIQDGDPSVYSIKPDGTLCFSSKPTENKTVSYESYATPVALVNNTDVPAMPERYHILIVYEALRCYAQFDEAPELEKRAFLYYEEMLADLERDQLARIGAPEALA
ncbi:MAG: hypothetical protein CL494_05270 [Actinobacteria bacterium]|nr:hypothetical protein [Actinomycetota bacterium]|tara:strand:- start:1101 stop:1724 length:624 start_codon:yes stop_codon:yes gene_type:complete